MNVWMYSVAIHTIDCEQTIYGSWHIMLRMNVIAWQVSLASCRSLKALHNNKGCIQYEEKEPNGVGELPQTVKVYGFC